MTIFEVVTLFWVLPSLITSLLVPHILDTGPRIIDLDRYDSDDWGRFSVVYPLGLGYVLIVILFNIVKGGGK